MLLLPQTTKIVFAFCTNKNLENTKSQLPVLACVYTDTVLMNMV